MYVLVFYLYSLRLSSPEIKPDLGGAVAFPCSDLCLPQSSLSVALFCVVTSGGDDAAIVSAVPSHSSVAAPRSWMAITI